jgi:hypothetical protein
MIARGPARCERSAALHGGSDAVVHSRDDAVQLLDQGRQLASRVSGAEFMVLESRNHIIPHQEKGVASSV